MTRPGFKDAVEMSVSTISIAELNPSSLFLHDASLVQTVADVLAILDAERVITKGVYTSPV